MSRALSKTCPQCRSDMVLVGPETAIKPLLGFEVEETPDRRWECPSCGSQCEIGQDVLAQMENRPRLL